MRLAWLPCVLMLLPTAAAAQDGKLELVNLRRTYGYLGAPRPKDGTIPGDTVYFTFEIKNLKLDDANKASYSIAIEIRDAEGKLIYEQKPHNSVVRNYFGGATVPCSAQIEIPLDAKPGPVNWKVTVNDRASKQIAVVAGKGQILPVDFRIVQVGLFGDAEAKVPMSAVGVVGDSPYLQFSTVGFARDKETKQPNVHVSMRILDEQGKPTTAQPIQGKIDSDVAAQAKYLPMLYGITFNRAGRFTLELTAEDRVAGKTARISYGVRVLPLE
ncbi:MAG TPA: hypothetical protein VFE62_28525 [Gemmataceae bacterium]|nr:hypothetical protein [Gemmataceae bacterium]